MILEGNERARGRGSQAEVDGEETMIKHFNLILVKVSEKRKIACRNYYKVVIVIVNLQSTFVYSKYISTMRAYKYE